MSAITRHRTIRRVVARVQRDAQVLAAIELLTTNPLQ